MSDPSIVCSRCGEQVTGKDGGVPPLKDWAWLVPAWPSTGSPQPLCPKCVKLLVSAAGHP